MTETPTPTPPAPEPEPTPAPEPTPSSDDDARIPRERLNQEAKKRRDAERKAEDLTRQLEEAQNAGLPEVDQLKKRLEAAEKRAEEADRKAQDIESKLERTRKERWVTAAAREQNFADPSDAAAFVELDDIESEKDAERAVKRLAGSKKHLVKTESPVLPGRVLENGRTASMAADGSSTNIDLSREAEMLAEGLKQFASKD